MRTFGIGTIFMAASLLTPAAFSQTRPPQPPRARSIAAVSGGYGFLGISTQDIDAERAKALKLNEVRGAEIKKVIDDSPAAKAGFKEGDVLLEFNGQKVEGTEQLTRMVRETPAGRQVKMVVSRNGAPVTLTATLEPAKGMVIDSGGAWVMPEVKIPEITIPPIPPMDMPRIFTSYQNPMLGITGESLAQQEQFAEFLGVKDGVLVKSVVKDSAAEKAGIKAGDVIIKVDDTKVSTSREITSALARSGRTNKKTATVLVVRNKKEMPITVTVEAYNGTSTRAMRIGPMIFGPVRVGPVMMMTRPLVIRPMTIQPMVITKPMVVRPRVVRPILRRLQFPAQDRVV